MWDEIRKMKPIERKPDGSHFSLTPGQARRMRRLVRQCCNNIDGNCLLLDRASISRKNSYIDPDGTIRVYFTVEETQKKLHRGRQCVTRIFRELEYTGLICRKKQGLGKPSVITLNYPDDARLITGKEESDVG